MTAPFAAIETATATSAVAALANVTATIGAVSGVEGIFDKDYAETFGISGAAPALRIISTAAPSAAVGDAVTLGAVSYTITAIEPDGTGMTLLRLQEA